MPPKVNIKLCTGCGTCVAVCPVEPKVYKLKDEKAHVVNPDACIECGACEASCPVEAIKLRD